MSATDLVSVQIRPDQVGIVTLRRPEHLNALSTDLSRAIRKAVDECAQNGDVRSLVIAGEGRSFCAGADITELQGLDGPHEFSAFIQDLNRTLDVLSRCPKPSVAAVQGVALGGGLELALACDLRVAEENARLGVPEIKLGLLPGAAGTARLPRMLPKAVAKEMLLTGEPLGAADAHRLGLVNQVAPRGEGLGVATLLAARLATLAPLALAAAKRLVDEGAPLPLDAAISFERETVSMLFATTDRQEGIDAFLDKRTPDFRGC
jgi:enoyl-CoA hydratase